MCTCESLKERINKKTESCGMHLFQQNITKQQNCSKCQILLELTDLFCECSTVFHSRALSIIYTIFNTYNAFNSMLNAKPKKLLNDKYVCLQHAINTE